MYTHCPECNTAFRISTRQLRMGQGRVKCSKCGTLFDAISSLSDIAFEDHYSDLRKLPTLPMEQALTPAVSEETLGNTELETAPDWDGHPQPGSRSPRFALWSGIFLMIALMVVQVGFFEGGRLVQKPKFRPWFEKVCGYLACKLPAYRNPAEIEILEKSLQAKGSEALEFRLVIINGSRYPQVLPRLSLDLIKFNGEPLARRVFLPEEYLSDPEAPRIAAGKILEIRLEFVKPEEEIGGYHFGLI